MKFIKLFDRYINVENITHVEKNTDDTIFEIFINFIGGEFIRIKFDTEEIRDYKFKLIWYDITCEEKENI